jgi:hypothetical protein
MLPFFPSTKSETFKNICVNKKHAYSKRRRLPVHHVVAPAPPASATAANPNDIDIDIDDAAPEASAPISAFASASAPDSASAHVSASASPPAPAHAPALATTIRENPSNKRPAAAGATPSAFASASVPDPARPSANLAKRPADTLPTNPESILKLKQRRIVQNVVRAAWNTKTKDWSSKFRPTLQTLAQVLCETKDRIEIPTVFRCSSAGHADTFGEATPALIAHMMQQYGRLVSEETEKKKRICRSWIWAWRSCVSDGIFQEIRYLFWH